MSGQKFMQQNRPPRVQIEYDVELYGQEKKVELPFVMGVLSDLSADGSEDLPPLAERSFIEIDANSFNERMKAMKPRLNLDVPNVLTGEGTLHVELKFESMDDFAPAAIARQVEPLAELLRIREKLDHLATYMDGKAGAEVLVREILNNKELMHMLAERQKKQATAEGY